MSTISASTTSTTAYKVTADTTGTLVLQTGSGPTTAITIGTDQSVTLAGTLTTSAKGIAKASLPAGSVLQVVQASYSSTTTTSSASYVTSNLTASITPSSSSSKILIIASVLGQISGSQGYNSSGYFTIAKNATQVSGDAVLRNYSYAGGSAGVYLSIPISLSYLDSPATTSSTTYAVYLKTGASTSTFINADGGTSYITLLEIAG